jgi:bifunctional non-homologous end joining protein LigD
MPLAEYRRKRRFHKTAEPAGNPRAVKKAKRLSFVVQKHDASRLHYDFRLELDGVLKSWAVPKGPAFDPSEKRLAVEVEDHPLEYAKFEGSIPEGEYGAGEVIVWDRGTWVADGDPNLGLRKGKLEFDLSGKKLHGRWVLVRLRGRERSGKPNWLLIKRHDEFARPLSEFDVLNEQPQSVKSGRTLEDLQSKATNGKPRARKKRASRKKRPSPAGGSKSPMPQRIDVELATLETSVPPGRQWLHEIKLDGYRLIAMVERGKTRLITRRHQDWTHRYRSIAQALNALPASSAILDGELVALLPSGLSSFQALQNSGQPAESTRLVYYAFDLLYLDGYDLRKLPLIERKERLRELLNGGDSPLLQYCDHIDADGAAFLRESCRLGLEGIISKRRDRPYVAGRSRDWVKVKCLGREELVIGGFTLSTADRRGIGALLVGYFHGKELIYAGRVGTGFNAQTLLDMRQRLEKLRQDECPFIDVPRKERGPMVKWVRPELVAEIQFGAWTDGEVLRQPSFQGLREDKSAADVSRPASLVLASGNRNAPGSNDMKTTMKRRPSQSPREKGIAGVRVSLTHPERVLFPDTGLTKVGLANYYAQIAEWILPHLKDRPLSLVRCPDGQAAGKCFYQKHVGAGTPKSLGRVLIEEKNGPEEYVYVSDVAGLVGLVQISVLEIHPWGSRRDNVEKPDRLTFDLDPGPGIAWKQLVEAALATRELLSEHGLDSFVKTTGGKGLHVVVPLAPRRHDWDDAKRFCKHVAGMLADQAPKKYTITMAKAARQGKIFVDYLRNDRGSTAVAAYSTRARQGAPVSTPINWNELTAISGSDHFRVENLPARLASLKRDPWAKIDEIRQSFPRVG